MLIKHILNTREQSVSPSHNTFRNPRPEPDHAHNLPASRWNADVGHRDGRHAFASLQQPASDWDISVPTIPIDKGSGSPGNASHSGSTPKGKKEEKWFPVP